MIKVSIILPVYNVEKYIDRCLKSLVNQTMKEIEILIINDGTLDNSMEICEKYAKIDQRIKIYNKDNEGLGLTRNYGLKRASGEYICFVDSDDYVTDDMCELLYATAKKYEADIVYGGIYRDNNEGKILKKPSTNSTKIWKGQDEIKNLLLDFIATKPKEKKDTIMEVSVWKAVFKKSIFDKYGINFVSEREFISEDVIFDIDFFLKSQCIVAIPDCVYFYCVNQNSLSKRFRPDRFRKVKILYEEIKNRLKKDIDKKELELRTDKFLIARARSNCRTILKHKKIIGTEETNKALDEILNDSDLQKILKRYPITQLPYKYALVAYFMKLKAVWVLKIILK